MTETDKGRPKKRKPPRRRPDDDTAFVVSSASGVFEHVADDLEDEETDSIYLRDVQHD